MRNRIALFCLITISAFSCKDVEKLTQFTMDFNNQVTIPANAVIDTLISISTPDIPTNSQATFSGNNTNAASIDKIQLQDMVLTIITPGESNFNFFKSVEVFIKTEGLSEVSLGSNTEIADGLTSLNLATTDANIKSYITAEKFSIRVAMATDEAITQDHEINIKTVFFVDAKVLGQ